MNVLVINAGSSSLKYQLLNPATGVLLAKGLCERIGIDGKFTYKPQLEGKEAIKAADVAMPTHNEAIAAVLNALVDEKNGVIGSMKEIQQNLDYYRANAAVIAAALDEAGVWYCGGKNSPYIWLRCPNEMGSWEFFDWLLEHAHVVGTPGEGFGPCGKGYFRLTAFGDAERTKEAAARIKAALATL